MTPKKRSTVPVEARYDIETFMGKVGVNGLVRGLFGIHEEIGDGYTLTHLPTGYAAIKGLSKARALMALREFDASPVNWQFSNPKRAPKATQEWGKEAANRYRARRVRS